MKISTFSVEIYYRYYLCKEMLIKTVLKKQLFIKYILYISESINIRMNLYYEQTVFKWSDTGS